MESLVIFGIVFLVVVIVVVIYQLYATKTVKNDEKDFNQWKTGFFNKNMLDTKGNPIAGIIGTEAHVQNPLGALVSVNGNTMNWRSIPFIRDNNWQGYDVQFYTDSLKGTHSPGFCVKLSSKDKSENWANCMSLGKVK